MKWDGKAYSDIVKKSVYAVLFDFEPPNALIMSNKEYADYLKRGHNSLGIYSPEKNKPDIKANTTGIKIIFKDRYLNNSGDNSIELPWSMAARHIRAWEYEKKMTETPHAGQGALSDPKPMKFEKGMKRFFKDIGYVISHSIEPSSKLNKMINDGDPKPLREFLKKEIGNSGYSDGKINYWGKLSQGVILRYHNEKLNDRGTSELVVSWSQLATLLRDDNFRETFCFPTSPQESGESTKPTAQQESKPKNLMQEKWDKTHLCSEYNGTHCECFFESGKGTVKTVKLLTGGATTARLKIKSASSVVTVRGQGYRQNSARNVSLWKTTLLKQRRTIWHVNCNLIAR